MKEKLHQLFQANVSSSTLEHHPIQFLSTINSP